MGATYGALRAGRGDVEEVLGHHARRKIVHDALGRIGTDGQTLTKKLTSPSAAQKEHDRLVAEKLKKGYALVGGRAPSGVRDPDRAGALPGGLRYENPKTKRFWEIAKKGEKTLLFRTGPIGKAGTRSEKTFDQAWKAAQAYDDLQRKKRADGFERREPPIEIAPSRENRELLEAILAAPDDPQGFLVYGDWLQGVGDPRGELIALMSAGKRAAAERWIEKHAPSLLGPLQPYRDTLDRNPAWKKRATEAFTWRLGFIERARLAFDYFADEGRGIIPLERVLDLVLTHPSGRVLRELVIGLNRQDPDCKYQKLLDVLSRRGAPCLKLLHVGDFEFPDQIEISWTEIGSLAKVWKAVPRLETLILQGGGIGLGALEHPTLRRIEIRTGGLPRAAMRSLAEAKLPACEHLDVWLGDESYGGDATWKDVAPLLSSRELPSLRHLGLRNAQLTDELARALPSSPILRQLKSVDLSLGTLTDEGARALADRRGALAHLDVLDVRNNLLTAEGKRLVKGVCKKVLIGEQREIEDWWEEDRYVAIGE
jgi:uncharacterized protein (TIGR02996 family)